MNTFELVDISIHDPLRKTGVVYVGQYGTSGYAIAARGYICDFIMRGVPISWTPLRFDDSEMSDDNHFNILAKTTINKPISDIRSIILHCTADLWPNYKNENKERFVGKNIIGYTVWESSHLPDKWSAYINENVNEVWCPSRFNEIVFRDSGVTIPIRIVPHVFLSNPLPLREHVELKVVGGETIRFDPNVITFYNISELNERKNVGQTLEAYCKAFTKSDPVRLILKVHYRDYSNGNTMHCISKIMGLLNQYPDHAPVYLLARNLTELELMGLHSICDCYVSLTRSEAFGLTIFDAFNYGKKIVVPGYGGQVDYLGPTYPGLVNFQMEDIKNMESFSHGYYMQGKQQWAMPNIDHAIENMRNIIKQ